MWLLPLLIVGTTVVLSVPTGFYLAWIADGRYRPPKWLHWVEQLVDTGPQDWKQYSVSMLLFNSVMFVFGYVVLSLQPLLPLNPDGKTMLAPTTIFHTTCSFLTNTDLQHYAGEQHLSYFSQLVVIGWYMFVSASVGFCALAAITRALRSDPHMGNYYLDMWRVVAYAFFPASLVMGVILIADGMPMTFDHAAVATTVEPGAMGTTPDGKPQPQVIARGPVAALLPIKHFGTNGGGFFGANSAHPYENPSAWSNFLASMNILFFPFALVVMFGRMLNNLRHAAMIYGVMMFMFVSMIVWAIYWDTLQPNPALTDQPARTLVMRNARGQRVEKRIPALVGLPVDQSLGNLEGKESRFGTSAGATFAAVTTAATCGSVNCAHDSLNPLAGLSPFFGLWINCVFGGKGVGLINMLIYIIIAVFLAGLLVGRTPEYLGKKVEARELKLAVLALLVHPILILAATGLFAAVGWGARSTSNPGPHGLAEIIYEFSSASANNGSEFGGLQQTWGSNKPEDNKSPPAPYSPQWDIGTGLVMLLGRFLPIIAPIAFAASLSAKKPTPFTVGTLRTDTITFGIFLLGTILLVGALLFMPAAMLASVAEHLGPTPFGG
ncbi:MAG TPA: potassium-transporting ATPase subunit KdpA [Gemmataceae bacterium]|nr:potassium-transporting ATPase subunit KdpA [Gemmataceae bacterium]